MPQDDASRPGESGPEVPQRSRRRRLVVIAGIVAALVVAGGGIAVAAASSHAEHEQAVEDAQAALDANGVAEEDNADARAGLVGAVERSIERDAVLGSIAASTVLAPEIVAPVREALTALNDFTSRIAGPGESVVLLSAAPVGTIEVRVDADTDRAAIDEETARTELATAAIQDDTARILADTAELADLARAVDVALAGIAERSAEDSASTLTAHPSAAQPERDALTAAIDALSKAGAPLDQTVAAYLTTLQAVKDSHAAVEAQKAQAAADAAAEAARDAAESHAGGGDSGSNGVGGTPIQWGPTGLRSYQPPPFDPSVVRDGNFWDGCRGLPASGFTENGVELPVFEWPWTYWVEGGTVYYVRCIEPL
ncbi:hypothetical protein ASC66_11805 [Leifsonia sp. Root4]|uniref:hypothetical protein n=1 Tax=Leifsonia sp. Root4 TaxID=1736525 RepID=UPI0006F6A86B|nr:hypothetical protein [Leifsonia sp. Root4]KQW05649.1 hypothetical protein ASC66_11805 [Leifsonia sp. Root4]